MSWLSPRRGNAPMGLMRASVVGIALAVAACAPQQPKPLDAGDVTTRRVFAVGLDNLDRRYIDPLRISDVTLAGLGTLGTIDPALRVAHAGGAVQLISGQRVIAAWKAPERADAYEWAALMGDILEAARESSSAVRAKNADEVLDAVFKGALKDADRYTHYDGRAIARRNRASRDGFGGIGVTIRVEGPETTVTEVTPGTPASRAGLKVNDRIVSVNQRSIVGATQAEVIDALRGPIDTGLSLGIVRGGDPAFDVSLARAFIMPQTAMLQHDGGILTIKLSSFNTATGRELRRELSRIERNGGARPKGIVIDLRGNPGGLLDQAVAVADLFLKHGRIISTIGRHPDANQIFDANGDEWLAGVPIVVIVNGRSASAAEIVAVSLRDNGRAVVLGSSSFGKGTVQTIVNLPNGGEMAMTWARLVAPSGRAIQDVGVVPTICTNSDAELVAGLLKALKADGETARIALAGYLNVRGGGGTPIEFRRSACPPAIEENAADIELARLIAGNERLYQRALLSENAAVATNTSPRP